MHKKRARDEYDKEDTQYVKCHSPAVVLGLDAQYWQNNEIAEDERHNAGEAYTVLEENRGKWNIAHGSYEREKCSQRSYYRLQQHFPEGRVCFSRTNEKRLEEAARYECCDDTGHRETDGHILPYHMPFHDIFARYLTPGLLLS